MEMDSEDLLLNDDPNLDEGDVVHSLEGVDVDGLLGDDDQSMGTHNDEVVDTEATAEEEFYLNEEEYVQEETTENQDEVVEEGDAGIAETEESMEEEEGPSSDSAPVNSNSNVCSNIVILYVTSFTSLSVFFSLSLLSL